MCMNECVTMRERVFVYVCVGVFACVCVLLCVWTCLWVCVCHFESKGAPMLRHNETLILNPRGSKSELTNMSMYVHVCMCLCFLFVCVCLFVCVVVSSSSPYSSLSVCS